MFKGLSNQVVLPSGMEFYQFIKTSLLPGLLYLLCVYFAYAIGILFKENSEVSVPQFSSYASEVNDGQVQVKPLTEFGVISARNLFGVTNESTQVVQKAPPKTKLKLRLVGTQTGNLSDPFAIIEDSAKNEQDIFYLNEVIFAGPAKLLDIGADSIRIEQNGQQETLEIEDGKGGGSGASASKVDEIIVSEQEISAALANLPVLVSQARAVPYFRGGASIGMRIFAIKSGSMYEKLGLKNGDIIKSVNSNSLSDPSQALKIFEQLKTEKNLQVTIERSGRDSEMKYAIR